MIRSSTSESEVCLIDAPVKPIFTGFAGDFFHEWLDAHPGVTLEYTLTYKDAEHLIVIPGGGNCANPSIPWYGPEYLIGLYESR